MEDVAAYSSRSEVLSCVRAEEDLELEVSINTGDKKDVETHGMHKVTAVAMSQARKLLFWAKSVSTQRRA